MTDTTIDRYAARSALHVRVTRILAGAGRRLQERAQEARLDQMRATSPTPGAIVLLGDSITEQGLWNEWFPDRRILNRGIAGETTTQILRRLDTVVAPRAVFLLAGTNDLPLGRDPDAIAGDLARIVDRLGEATPSAMIVVQTIMPRQAMFARDVVRINRRLRELTDARPDRTRLLDLWPILATPDGALRGDYTRDNLHLNGAGYRAWVDAMRPVLGEVDR